MVRFKHPSDPHWIRRPAVHSSTGRAKPGFAEFKNRKTRETWVEDIGENYTFEIRIEGRGTTYKPAGKKRSRCRSQALQIAAKLDARAQSEAAGLIVIDPAQQEKKRLRLDNAFDDYGDGVCRPRGPGDHSSST